MDCSPPGSSVHGILQARILEWVVVPSSRGSSQPGTEPASLKSLASADRFFTTITIWEAPYIYTTMCKTDSWGSCYIILGVELGAP